MPAEAVVDVPEAFTAAAVPLLKEYSEKLNSIADKLRSMKTDELEGKYDERESRNLLEAEYNAAERLFQRLDPAAANFARQVSGMVGQGRISPLEKTELRLRLAEFESALFTVNDLLQACRPNYNRPVRR